MASVPTGYGDRRDYKQTKGYLKDQPVRGIRNPIPRTVGTTFAGYRTAAEFEDISCVVMDQDSGYLAFVGQWRDTPAVLEASGMVVSEDSVGPWRYAIAYPGHFSKELLEEGLPQHRILIGAYPHIETEGLRRINGTRDHGERSMLEETLTKMAEEIEARFA